MRKIALLCPALWLGCSDPDIEPSGEDAPRAADGLPIEPFSATYGRQGWLGWCDWWEDLDGYAPTTGGPYPLYVHLRGTMDWTDEAAIPIVQEAARRGFVAVHGVYDNMPLALQGWCGGVESKARCMFDESEANSLVARLCARDDLPIDCDLGIVVSGHSQGAQIANYARNWNAKVRAKWGIADTCKVTSDIAATLQSGSDPNAGVDVPTDGMCDPDPQAEASRTCLLPAHSALTADGTERVRTHQGEDDVGHPNELRRITGVDCEPGDQAQNCQDVSGAGWYVIDGSEVSDGTADHNYFMLNWDEGIDPMFIDDDETAEHVVRTNADWLRTWTGPDGLVPLRINAGQNRATQYAGGFSKDGFLTAGDTTSTTTAGIDTSAPNAAPPAVYQAQRSRSWWGAVKYTFTGLAPDTSYTVRLHFAEINTSVGVGGRYMSVWLNGVKVENALDVRAEAGGPNIALVRSHTATTDGAGDLVVDVLPGWFQSVAIAGIEILAE